MATAPTLEQYLTKRGVAYDVLTHDPTMSSLSTAKASRVSANAIAKAVVLKVGEGYLLAVLPASRHLEWEALTGWLNQHVALAREDEIERLFPDCSPGAVPPLGEAYGLETIVDDSITEQTDVYFEGGDHATLVHVSGPAFSRLMTRAKHGRFSGHH